MGPRQDYFQLRAASLRRSCLLYERTYLRIQLLAFASILRMHIHNRLGIRHRGVHGTSIHTGPVYNSDSGQYYRRRILPRKTPYSQPRLYPARLTDSWQHGGVSYRPRKRSHRPVPWKSRTQTAPWKKNGRHNRE